MLESISNEGNIREGVFAFRNFIYQLCEVLITDANLYDNHKKNAHESRYYFSIFTIPA